MEGKRLPAQWRENRYGHRHLEMACEYKGEIVGVKEMRKHIAVFKRNEGSNPVKNAINRMIDKEEIKETLLRYRDQNRNSYTPSPYHII